ncbi:MAG: HAD-IIIA family hydrolase [Sedimentisphaerales bacterium]|nr:HAD-IIIA family hydrolase [Sedimentisphaerales bacterium]
MQNFADIKMLVMDVDGVLTDGAIIVNADGTETKSFSVLDGHGIRLWHRAGLETAIISGRASGPTRLRADQLGVKHVIEDCHYKLPALEQLLEQIGLTPENAAYIGDDIPDLPVINYVGFGVAVANAVDEVKKNADYVTDSPGGRGAVREVIEHILKSTGKWSELMERYLSDE